MSSDLLRTSITGLRVSQSALSTTGHNISNAGVDGYSRQRVLTETNPATLKGGGYIGNGASVSSVERIVNDFVSTQLRTDTALFHDLDVYLTNVSQLDNLLSDVDSGLSSALESFFTSMQNGADDPTSLPARQLIISEAENLADRFNAIYSRFESIENGIDESLKSAVSRVNALSANLADINRKISDAIGSGGGASPNDLLDQRDEALRELSELISIQTYDQGNGQVNVVIGSGQNLVVGDDPRRMELIPSASDAGQFDLVFADSSNAEVITGFVSGGEIGGLFRFRDEIMNDSYNEFGRIAIALADTINNAHQQGIDLDNEFGKNFFYDVNDPTLATARVVGNSNNADPSDRVLRLNITDSTQLTASDYNVEIEGGGLYRIQRLSDGVEVASGLFPGSFPFSANFDGLELVFDQGSFQAGDQFKLQPFKSGGRDFSTVIFDPQSVAFASPLSTGASLGNLGSGKVSAGDVLSLVDKNGNALPLLANAGELDPPLIVHFTSDTTYDVLDNSDPGNPVQLDPPIRNQVFVPGVQNNIFPTDEGETLVSTSGDMIGIPDGRRAVTQAAILFNSPPATAPDYTVSDFSASTNQFSFDVVVSNTLGGVNDGTYSVTINGPAIVDDTTLLNTINTQLSGSNVVAYIADNGTLAFRSNSPGYGDVSLQNYNGDPDGGGDFAAAGQANNLFGFDIEGSTFTTVADADGISGEGFVTNGYPAEVISITAAADTPGGTPQTQNIYTDLNASAKEIASTLNNVNGVSANAFNYVELSNYQVTGSSPLQFYLNGEALLEYEIDSATGNSILSPDVPDPQTAPDDFNEYLANAINSNSDFKALGIHASAAVDPLTGNSELRIYASQGDDLNIQLTASQGESIDVGDDVGSNLSLSGVGNSLTSSVTVGGRLDVALADGLSLGTFPPDSMIFGDTAAADFAESRYMGIQVSISGVPKEGDDFTIGFNVDGAFDNRNALELVDLQTAGTIDGGSASYTDSYGSLVERIGIDTSSAKINANASEQVLDQTTQLRNSISAVNLDEEAANLIRFEQMYSANAQVISVARDLFDTLLGSF